jgi:hypothetical protein
LKNLIAKLQVKIDSINDPDAIKSLKKQRFEAEYKLYYLKRYMQNVKESSLPQSSNKENRLLDELSELRALEKRLQYDIDTTEDIDIKIKLKKRQNEVRKEKTKIIDNLEKEYIPPNLKSILLNPNIDNKTRNEKLPILEKRLNELKEENKKLLDKIHHPISKKDLEENMKLLEVNEREMKVVREEGNVLSDTPTINSTTDIVKELARIRAMSVRTQYDLKKATDPDEISRLKENLEIIRKRLFDTMDSGERIRKVSRGSFANLRRTLEIRLNRLEKERDNDKERIFTSLNVLREIQLEIMI